jgi:hypothetical protein
VEKYQRAFLSIAPDIIFMLSYGISQLITARYTTRTAYSIPYPGAQQPSFSQKEVEMDRSLGFGQVTAIFLLVVPIFAAAEIYYGM